MPLIDAVRAGLTLLPFGARDSTRLGMSLGFIAPVVQPRELRLVLDLGDRAASARRLPLNLGVLEVGGGEDPAPVVGSVRLSLSARWSRTHGLGRTWSPRWGALVPRAAHVGAAWGGLASRRLVHSLGWDAPAVQRASTVASWRASEALHARALFASWDSPEIHARATSAAWRGAQETHARGLAAAWNAPPAIGRAIDARWRGSMTARAVGRRLQYSAPPLQMRKWGIPWGRGDGLPWFIRPPKPPLPPPPPGRVVDGTRLQLDLACRAYTDDARRLPLNLGITACWLARPQRKVFVVVNEFSVVRLPDRLPIHVDAISIAGGRDSGYWDAGLALADPEQLDALAPTVDGPRAIEITINGHPWVVQVEAFDSARVHGSTEVSVRGRSVTAQLAEPYAAARTRETTQVRTMVQLADAEVAGTPITVDYGTVDWLVPAGAWYYDSLTPMAALARIAEAAGAVVQSHPSEPMIQIRPRYPASPWAWTTTAPDAVVQDDIVTGTRLQLQSRPLYDAVIVAGERVGVSAKVRRSGEAGQTFAPQQIDQLITHADGARERGRNVLSDRGGQAQVEIDIPLFRADMQAGQPGLILPLMLVQRITQEGTWHGLATGVRIEARRQEKAVEVIQTVTLERHYTDAD